MGFLSVIRRWAFRDKMPIREIARRAGLSRNTIKKYLRAGIVEPRFQTPARPTKLDPYAEKLSGWLVTEQRICLTRLNCRPCCAIATPFSADSLWISHLGQGSPVP